MSSIASDTQTTETKAWQEPPPRPIPLTSRLGPCCLVLVDPPDDPPDGMLLYAIISSKSA